MAIHAGLSCQDTVISDGGAAGNSGLGAEETIRSHLYVMAQVDEIINFCTIADDRIVQGTVVHRGAGTNFHIVTDNRTAQLANVVMMAVFIGRQR